MTISLKIDNCDSLPDGGPLQFTSGRRGFDIGREQHLDWTLPDPNRMISGRHCEVRFEKGGYWLYDISRNGTYVNGATARVKSPYKLQDGDRLQIGHYVISVAVTLGPELAQDEEETAHAPFGAGAGAVDGIWDTGGPAPPPISRRELMPPERRGRRAADFSEQYLQLPELQPSSLPAEGQPASPPFGGAAPQSPFGAPAGESPFAGPAQPATYPPAGQQQAAAPQPPLGAPVPPVPQSPFPAQSEPFAPARAAPLPPAGVPQAAPRMPQAAPLVTPSMGGDGQLLARIAIGAGIDPHALAQRDPGEVAEEIGAVLRATVEELTQLLKARAAAKVLAKSSNRTMISAVDNNPLKFIPLPEEAIEIMFAHRRAGYLDAKRTIEDSFRDLKTHEFATYAAMQKALARLLDDLSPEAIEKKVASSTFSSKKGKAWDAFVATWEAKADAHENGMLDIFLAYFADAYEKATKA